tara:strand:- start:404 stop:595 length:192 start_codon:yes stop_codon:yes gene_type:complete
MGYQTFKELWLENIKREKKRLDFCKKKMAYWKRQTELSIASIEVDQKAIDEKVDWVLKLYGKK